MLDSYPEGSAVTPQSFFEFETADAGYRVQPVTYEETKHFILNIHYARRMPSISYAFGLLKGGELLGVVTYGMPASQHLCRGVCGDEKKDIVIELNRLCLLKNGKNEASMLVSRSLKMLPKPMVVVSYADTAQGHLGTVYQACNFLFTGSTRERTDIASADGKHSRHNLGDLTQRQNRSSKHRYIYLVGTHAQVRELQGVLKYTTKTYPKK
jgi:hypothetical protein